MNSKVDHSFIKDFYLDQKNQIDFIGFFGVVTALFLQISQYQNDSLKMIQALLLLVFSFSLSYILLVFLSRLISDVENNKLAPFDILLSSVTFLFVGNLFKFIRDAFGEQLATIFDYSRLGLFILGIFYCSRVLAIFFSNKRHESIKKLIIELVFIILLNFLIIRTNHLSPMVILNLAFLLGINYLLSLKAINLKKHFVLTAIWILVVFLFTLINQHWAQIQIFIQDGLNDLRYLTLRLMSGKLRVK